MTVNPRATKEITQAVHESFEHTPSPRLRRIMQSLVTHLHAFVTDVELTEDEWAKAIEILTATGHITDDKRQEFILWSDTLGVSMLVDALAHPAPDGATESTILGPFYVPGSPLRPLGSSMAEQEAGTPAHIFGQVRGLDGKPIAGAELDVWQNGDNRLYAVQDPDAPEFHLRGRFRTDDDGRFSFWAVRPVPYAIPDDGPVGKMLNATARHPWRAAHVHLVVKAPGYRSLTTHIFDAESDYLDSDTVFAVKESLCLSFTEHGADDPGRPEHVTGPWVSLDLPLVLAPSDGEDGVVTDRGRTH
ncbi:dioxygenase family protein [Amycolatopsis pithecellobii]|uniref:6-chlorohydroxyquinol-1,2-dioxygenase n=1 Tax=Amycolatopsis pithecellobii TaxID=664692 RepID=A0A6N7YN24_9PSEU|nr:dioxygenase [Amycolatopsis pithecellobii]MTD54387.1 6-chlorohydroxyquinol-1,2-dioxygenase [Amycolatopsis pithecellobii]